MFVSGAVFSQEWKPQTWPVLKQYDREHLYQVALPLGGIGTGTVSLGGRGELRDWEIMNVPGKKYSTVTTGNNAPFFAIYAKPQTGEAMTTLLAGPLYPQEYLHYEGRPGCYFWSNGYAWGTCTVTDDTATIEVLKGSLQLDKLVIGDKEKRLKNFRLASGENRIIKLS